MGWPVWHIPAARPCQTCDWPMGSHPVSGREWHRGWGATNTLPLPVEKRIPKIQVLSVAPILADALAAVFDETSVSELFGGENQS